MPDRASLRVRRGAPDIEYDSPIDFAYEQFPLVALYALPRRERRIDEPKRFRHLRIWSQAGEDEAKHGVTSRLCYR